MVYLDPTYWPAPSWLVSSVGRALHRYRRGHGFKSRTGLNFFQVLLSTTSSVVLLAARISYIRNSCIFSNCNVFENRWIYIYIYIYIYICYIKKLLRIKMSDQKSLKPIQGFNISDGTRKITPHISAWKERSVSVVRVIYPRKEHKKGNKQTKTNVAKIEETLLLK